MLDMLVMKSSRKILGWLFVLFIKEKGDLGLIIWMSFEEIDCVICILFVVIFLSYLLIKIEGLCSFVLNRGC